MSGIKMEVIDDGVSKLTESLSNLNLGTKFYDGVGAIVAGDIIGNIESGRQADGTPIKQNSPSTKEKKRRRGGRIRSLIDLERRFVRKGRTSWAWRATSKSVTIEPTSVGSSAPLKKLVRLVQKKGYTGWFATSKKGKKAIRELLRLRIKRILKKL